MLLPPHSIPTEAVFPLFPLQNPTMTATASLDTHSAIAAFQQSMQSMAMSQCIESSSIPPALGSDNARPQISQFYRNDCLGSNTKIHELSLRAPRTRREEMLVDKWSTKLAMSSLDSEIINETAEIWRCRVRDELDVKWQHIENVVHSRSAQIKSESCTSNVADQSFEFNIADQSVYDAVITNLITQCDVQFLSELRSTMSFLEITQSVGMMKGVMDGLRDRIKMASMRYSHCTTDVMRQLFESVLLPMWCSLIKVATNDIRDGLGHYLSDEAFLPFYHFNTALGGKLARCLEADGREMARIRSSVQQNEFMENTRNHHDKMVMLLDHLSLRHHHNTQQRNEVVLNQMSEGNGNERKRILDVPMAPPPRKKRKKCRHHLFRKDGTLRKQQVNPCVSRRCKQMWQTDGRTRGCGGGTHPRGVCPCWKALGFSKVHVKNGSIQRWLENKHGIQGGKFKK